MYSFYDQYSTPCGQFSVIGTMDTTDLKYDFANNSWTFSIFIECKDRVNNLVDYCWVNFLLKNGKIMSKIFEKRNALLISHENYDYILESVGVIRNQIDSAIVFSIASETFKQAAVLPPVASFTYTELHRQVTIQFENFPISFSMNLQPVIGITYLNAYFSIGERVQPFFGCILQSKPEHFLGEEMKEQINTLIKEKIKLKYLF